MEHFEELLPIVSVPTVREACQRYGLMFKSLPRGLFITLEDRGRVFRWAGRGLGTAARKELKACQGQAGASLQCMHRVLVRLRCILNR